VKAQLPSAPAAADTAAVSAYKHHWAAGTNVPALGMGIVNAWGEVTIDHKWSAALSLYYSAWDYGSATRKFRTFIFRPEIRCWPRGVLGGFYAQFHLQMAWYNFALPSWCYRIQDASGRHPALGGGIGAGYRLPLGRGRWALDAAIGAGVYHLKYDRYENRKNGPRIDTQRRIWVGIDNVSVSVVYNFNSATR